MNEQFNKKSAAEQAGKAGQQLEICYSGGKDSDVILEVAIPQKKTGRFFTFS